MKVCVKFSQVCRMASNKNILRGLATVIKGLNFDDHHSVFTNKSNWELLRALVVLRLCGSNYLVDNSLQLFHAGQRILGNKGLELLLESTIYKQFVAGKDGKALTEVTKKLGAVGLKLMVAPTLEEDIGECNSRQERYDCNLQELIQLAEHTSKHGGKNSCLQTKITALLSADTLLKLSKVYYEANSSKKLSLVEEVSNAMINKSSVTNISGIRGLELNNLYHAVSRFSVLGKTVGSLSLHLLVDAEYSYLNPGSSLIALAMMAAFNQDQPVVANTYQCYFNYANELLLEELALTEKLKCCFAAKIVRGAYLERERQLNGNHICQSYSETGNNFDRVVDAALKTIAQNDSPKNLFLVATHNESSIRRATEKMKELGISSCSKNIYFAQIYGMADQISIPLAVAGYRVYKSVPLGPLVQVLPYLARRLAENRSVLRGARREMELLHKELLSRLTLSTARRA